MSDSRIKTLIVIFLILIGVFLYQCNVTYKDFYKKFDILTAIKVIKESKTPVGTLKRTGIIVDASYHVYAEGKNLYLQGRREEGFAKLNEAVTMNPKLRRAYVMLGVYYQNKGMEDAAVEAYKKATSPNADNDKMNEAVAYYNLGVIYSQKYKDYPNAIWHFVKSIEVAPNLKHESMDQFGALAHALIDAGMLPFAFGIVYLFISLFIFKEMKKYRDMKAPEELNKICIYSENCAVSFPSKGVPFGPLKISRPFARFSLYDDFLVVSNNPLKEKKLVLNLNEIEKIELPRKILLDPQSIEIHYRKGSVSDYFYVWFKDSSKVKELIESRIHSK